MSEVTEYKMSQVVAILKVHFKTRNLEAFESAALDLIEELSRKPERKATTLLLGFQIIGDMTKDELIAECVEFQRALWAKTDLDTMKHMVITARSEVYKQRLTAEARLSPPSGFLGWTNPNGPVKTDE